MRHRRFITGLRSLALVNGNGSFVIEETLDFVSALRRHVHYMEPRINSMSNPKHGKTPTCR
jgi:hypothetical protein